MLSKRFLAVARKTRLAWAALLLVLAGLLIFVLLHRNALQKDLPGAIFRQSPCDLPCFYNIVPGESTLEEAERQLERYFGDLHPGTNPFVAVVCADGEHSAGEWGECHLYFGVGADRETLIIDSIDLTFQPEISPSCSDIYALYGEPDHFFDWYNEDAYALFYDELQLEFIIDELAERYVYVWIRASSRYQERIDALNAEYPLGETGGYAGYQTQFDYQTHCAN